MGSRASDCCVVVPGCKCYGDTWIFDTTANEWSAANASDAPIHRYRQSLVLDAATGAVYLFGGESYSPYMYHNAVNKLVLSGPKITRLLGPPAGNERRGARKSGGKARLRERYS